MSQVPQASGNMPTSFGNYQMVRLLGKGGMGEVYLAEHPLLHKKVAAKVLSHELCRVPQQVARFQQEAVAVCRIGHPAIVEVFDFGTLPDGRVYYLMEYLEGQDLAEYLKANGPVSPARCLEIAAPAMEALGAAHRAGIVHRDVKPDNLFLARIGGGEQVKVLDFGIAKLLDSSEGALATATRTGMILGTPVYMAPEQAAGAIQKIGPATDVYAMAVVIYHMLCGRPPFLADSQIEILMQHLKTPPPRLTLRPGEVTESLDAVLRRALAKEPQDRYASMEEFLEAFRGAVARSEREKGAGRSRGAVTGTATQPSGMATGPGPGTMPPPPEGQTAASGTSTGATLYPDTVASTGAPLADSRMPRSPTPGQAPAPQGCMAGRAPSQPGLMPGQVPGQSGLVQNRMQVPSPPMPSGATRTDSGGIPAWAGLLLGLVGLLVLIAIVGLVFYLQRDLRLPDKAGSAVQKAVVPKQVQSTAVPAAPQGTYRAPGAKPLSKAEEDRIEAKIDALWKGLDPEVRESKKGLSDPKVLQAYQALATKMAEVFREQRYADALRIPVKTIT